MDHQELLHTLWSSEPGRCREAARQELRPQPLLAARPVRKDSSALDVVDAFLEWVHKDRSAETCEWCRERPHGLIERFSEFQADERLSSMSGRGWTRATT